MSPDFTIPQNADTRGALEIAFKLVPNSGMPVFSIKLVGRTLPQTMANIASVLPLRVQRARSNKAKASPAPRSIRQVYERTTEALLWLPGLSRYAKLQATTDATLIYVYRPETVPGLTAPQTA